MAERIEIIERRTLNTKTFALSSGQFATVSRPLPYHYYDGQEWREINPSWGISTDGIYQAHDVPFQTDIVTGLLSFSWVFTASDSSLVSGSLHRIGGDPIASIPGVNLQDSLIRGHQAVWRNVVPGCDLLALLSWAGVSWNWVIKHDRAIRQIDWQITEDIGRKGRVDLNVRGRDNASNVDRADRIIENQRRIEVLPPIEGDLHSAGNRRTYMLKSGWTGRVQQIDPVTRVRSWSSTDVVYPVRVDPTVTEDIGFDDDDGHEAGATWYPGVSTNAVNMGGRNSVTLKNGGLRFRSVNVPQGATITSATLTIEITATWLPANINIYADDVDSAPLWSDSSRPSQITKTTASANISPSATGSLPITVTSIVQEIVDRGGWAANNDIRFAFMSEGAYANGYHYIKVVDFSTWGSPNVAQLEIIYTEGTPVAYEQEGYRWRDDDASSGTFLAAQDASITRDSDTNTRLRLLIDTANAAASAAFSLQYKLSSEAASLWRNVGTGLAGNTPTVSLLGNAASGAADAASLSISVTPATIQVGDLLIMLVSIDGIISGFTGPSGWSTIPGTTNGNPGTDDTPYAAAFYKIAVSSDTSAGSYSCSWTTNQERAGVILRVPAGEFDSSSPFSIAANGGITGTTTTNAPLSPSVTTTRNNCLIIRAFAADDDDAASENDGSLSLSGGALFDLQPATNGPTLFGGYHSQALAGPSGTFTFALAANEEWYSWSIAVQPALSAPQILLADSTHLANGAATSAELTAPSSGAFQPGEFHDTTLTTGSISFDTDEYTELEWCISADSSEVSAGEVYQFRTVIGSVALDTYTVTPSMTISGAAAPSTSIASLYYNRV